MTKEKKLSENSQERSEGGSGKSVPSSTPTKSEIINNKSKADEAAVSHSPTLESISLDGLSFVNESCLSTSCRCKKSQKRSKAIDNSSECNAFGPSSPKIFKLKSNTELSTSKNSCVTSLEKAEKHKNLLRVANKISKSHSTLNVKYSTTIDSNMILPSFGSKAETQDFKNLVSVPAIVNKNANTFLGANFNTLRFNRKKFTCQKTENKIHTNILSDVETENSINVCELIIIEDVLNTNKINETNTVCKSSSYNNSPSNIFSNCSQTTQQPQQQSILTSCSHEAFTVNASSSSVMSRNDADDWTTDELSCYFEDFCYIPKKMSEMAKMMYA